MNDEITTALLNLEEYVRRNKFKGIDPYDALNSEKLEKLNSTLLRVIFTQFFVYSPINFRDFFQIKRDINPKALGLFLTAYCNMYKLEIIDNKFFEDITSEISELLLDKASVDYSGYCWGFNFNWQDIKRDAKKFTPTLVISSFIGNGFLDLYEITKNKKFLDIAINITKFILNDLHIRESSEGICFSYTPIDDHVVHNANFLGAAFLARVWYYHQNENFLDLSRKAVNYSVSRQNKDGSFEFQYFPDTDTAINVFDFHQGFIIESLIEFLTYTKLENEVYYDSLKRSAEFYIENQFRSDGRAKWRLPYPFPIDIHHQAQGIISFSKLYNFTEKPNYLDISKTIANWTIDNMMDERGFFYYQKWPIITNKIEYMRWGQAWMMKALSQYLLENKCITC